MSPSELVKWGALGAVPAGVAWVVSGLISVVIPGQDTEVVGSSSYYLLETIFCIATVGMLGGLALGYALWSQRGASAEQTSRVS